MSWAFFPALTGSASWPPCLPLYQPSLMLRCLSRANALRFLGHKTPANGRYLEAPASVRPGASAGAVAQRVCRPLVKEGCRHRGLNLWAEPDTTPLEVISRGEWTVSGFRNRDVRAALYPGKANATETRRRSGRVTRALARWRAHGLIRKVGGTHRYQVTPAGRQIITALLAARQADVEKLMALAA